MQISAIKKYSQSWEQKKRTMPPKISEAETVKAVPLDAGTRILRLKDIEFVI
jgi:hypothetical protein